MPVRDLVDGQHVDCVLLCREVEVRTKRDGTQFLKLTFADRTGSVGAMVWDGVTRTRSVCEAGAPVRVLGRYEVHPRYGPQLTLRSVRAPEAGTFRLEELCDGPARAPEVLEIELRVLLDSLTDPHLRALLDLVFAPDTATWPQFRTAPAAKRFHQAYAHGLLEHVLSVAQGVDRLAAVFPEVDRELAVAGALLHDIGKLDELTVDGAAFAMTDLGRMAGHIPLGYYRVRRLIEDVPGFPEPTAAALLHVVLSHHGCLEHGSPVVPCTREATLVHFVDSLGARLGSFDRVEKELPAGAAWSGFDRAIGAAGLFAAPRGERAGLPPREAPLPIAAAAPVREREPEPAGPPPMPSLFEAIAAA